MSRLKWREKDLNSKHEARNSKQIQNSNVQMSKIYLKNSNKVAYALEVLVLNFDHLNLFRISGFDIRISDLNFLKSCHFLAIFHKLMINELRYGISKWARGVR